MYSIGLGEHSQKMLCYGARAETFYLILRQLILRAREAKLEAKI